MPRLRYAAARDDGIKLSRGETAVDVTFQMCNGGLLARNHMFHKVADRDHPDHLVIINAPANDECGGPSLVVNMFRLPRADAL